MVSAVMVHRLRGRRLQDPPVAEINRNDEAPSTSAKPRWLRSRYGEWRGPSERGQTLSRKFLTPRYAEGAMLEKKETKQHGYSQDGASPAQDDRYSVKYVRARL